MKQVQQWILAALLTGSLLTGCSVSPAKAAAPVSVPSVTQAQVPVTPKALVPVYGNQLQDGSYPIKVSSSSSMFRVIDAQLTVAQGAMTAVLTLSGDGYEKLFLGTGQDAQTATEDRFSKFVPDANGKYTYTVAVSALDQEIDCAAFSIKKQAWYDRVLIFESASLPQTALRSSAADQPASGHLPTTGQLPAEGQYTIGVTLEGGSGRASVESPARLSVSGKQATATIIWSSPNYDYMLVGGKKYLPVNTAGNSTFEIPVTLDEKLAVIADTTAMGKPREVEYTLFFDSASLKK